METQVMISPPAIDLNFDSACTSPYISAPSSPPFSGTPFVSAPTSPTRAAAFNNDFNNFPHRASLSAAPFNWDEKSGILKTTQPNYSFHNSNEDTTDFAFDFSGQLEKGYSPADELFDGGKIKPLKPPPSSQYEINTASDYSPNSPRSNNKMFKEAFSPLCKKKDLDPIPAAIENTQMENSNETKKYSNDDHQKRRNQRPSSSNYSPASNPKHTKTRSLSTLRVSDLLFDREDDQEKPHKQSSSSSISSSWYGRWKIKDLLLFRSASEGRAASKSQLIKKYTELKKSNNQDDDVKNASFRSNDSGGRRSGPVSAHELHYTMKRAATEEMKRKTTLPYKQGLFGCLGFHPTVNEISRGIGSL